MEQLVKVNIPEQSRRLAKIEAARQGITLAEYLANLIDQPRPSSQPPASNSTPLEAER